VNPTATVEIGHWPAESVHKQTLRCELFLEREANSRIGNMLISLSQEQLPIDGTAERAPPFWVDEGEYLIAPDGKIAKGFSVSADYLPQSLREFFRELGRQASAAARQALGQVRWRQAASSPHSPISIVSSRWGFDASAGFSAPGDISVAIEPNRPISSTSKSRADIEALAASSLFEPLGHELIREARDNRSNRRSSLLIAVAALEAGVKSHVASIAPDAEWFFENSESPPIVYILTSLIPRLHKKYDVKSSPFPLPDKLVRFISKRVAQRNQVAHGSPQNISPDDRDDFIEIVESLLCVLDACVGHEWAKGNVPSHFCELIGWKGIGRRASAWVTRPRAWLD
jgi:hypothetical protein